MRHIPTIHGVLLLPTGNMDPFRPKKSQVQQNMKLVRKLTKENDPTPNMDTKAKTNTTHSPQNVIQQHKK